MVYFINANAVFTIRVRLIIIRNMHGKGDKHLLFAGNLSCKTRFAYIRILSRRYFDCKIKLSGIAAVRHARERAERPKEFPEVLNL